MNISFSDIVMYGVLTLVVALGANHYLDLNISALNDIQEIFSGSGRRATDDALYNSSPGGSDYRSSTDADCKRAKVGGDSRMMLRKAIAEAKKDRDMDRLSELEDNWENMERRDREACE